MPAVGSRSLLAQWRERLHVALLCKGRCRLVAHVHADWHAHVRIHDSIILLMLWLLSQTNKVKLLLHRCFVDTEIWRELHGAIRHAIVVDLLVFLLLLGNKQVIVGHDCEARVVSRMRYFSKAATDVAENIDERRRVPWAEDDFRAATTGQRR
ncbi:hypothetical protein AC578_10517 [Pseudocercospora eumusae]|uniref:Uncharacterized protein n=1 Tax=Pseudocercospora eumusae TaxID=321146 RepID=A0A139GV72_9PEZI|nr:hypothetical protein AC578_10517 [Pseudocercospora eumusae]